MFLDFCIWIIERWSEIRDGARESIFGNVVNFPFSAVKNHLIKNELSFDPTEAIETDIHTLFITGSLDCRTPIQKVEETMKGFGNALHIKVENAGHEQAMWERETFNECIPAFLLGKEICNKNPSYSKIEFLPLEGETRDHPAVK